MKFFDILPYVAWVISAALLGWIVVDAFRVSRQYDEEFLMSSREGDQ
jgi:hypothetical protein